MDSDKDIRVILKNILFKFFSTTEIPDELRKVYIGKSEMEQICHTIFPDIDNLRNNVISEDVLIDLELFQGLGADRENSIFSNLNLCKTNLGGFLLKNIKGANTINMGVKIP